MTHVSAVAPCHHLSPSLGIFIWEDRNPGALAARWLVIIRRHKNQTHLMGRNDGHSHFRDQATTTFPQI